MNILFFSHYFPPEGNAPAARTHENCRQWAREGHKVTVITCVPNCPDGVVYDGYKNRIRQEEVVDGIRVIRVWTFVAANKGTLMRIINFLSYMMSSVFFSLFIKKPDVIIATSPQFFCGWAGAITSWIRRVPFILEIRDLWPDTIVTVSAIKNGKIIKILEWLEINMYKAGDYIITVGAGYKKLLQQKGVPENKISIVMNGVDRNLFKPREEDKSLLAQYGLEGKFICSYIGTIGLTCGLDVVLRTGKILKSMGRDDIVIMLVGDGAVREELQSKAISMGLNNIIFTGRQQKTMMPNYISIADVCLVHLKKTNLFATVMPSKIFEIAGMGKPIINGVHGFASDFIKIAGAGICIEPENENDLLEKILFFFNNPEEKDKYGDSGRRYVIEHYDREILASEYLSIIKNIISNRMGVN